MHAGAKITYMHGLDICNQPSFLFSVYARVLYFTHVCHDGEWDVVPQLHACTRTLNDIIASYRNYKSCVRNYKRFYEDTCA